MDVVVSESLQRAIAAYQRRDWPEAERLCRAVLAIRDDVFDALHLLGVIAAQTRRPQEALLLLSKAVSLDAGNAEAHNTRGVALRDLQRHDEALGSYDRALALKPDYAEAHNNRGVVLRILNRQAEAVASYDHALAFKPNFAEAYNNRGIALAELKRYPEALRSYEQALRLKPDYPFLYGSWVHTKMQICDWSDIAQHFTALLARLERGERVVTPFHALAMPSSSALQRKAAEIVVRDIYPPSRVLGSLVQYPKHDRIRLAYFSADFHDHATMHLMAGLFEHHDKSKFHLSAFSFGPDSSDAARQRAAAAFDEFVDARDRSDQDIAVLARQREIDIAIDLKGFTQNSRPGIFACRAAPIQVSYLGYPATMGAEYIDYLIADATLVPQVLQPHYAERIVYMPHTYQVNDDRRAIADRTFSRQELGLPDNAFVFCCFNNSYKIASATFDRWMGILRRVAGSVLWLLEDNEWGATNLRSEAARRGIAADRLIFAKPMPLPLHLARHRVADLFLDTLPYNAHTTASDALWAGLPVLTCAGETFAGRVAASLLQAIELPELVTSSWDEYEALAIELASDSGKLESLKRKLAANRVSKPLFDTALFTRHIETAYVEMYERSQHGMSPAHIRVQP